MTSLPPPPPVLAFGGPPPPDGLLPPFPVVGSVPPPLLKPVGPPSRIPFTPTVLLTKVPPFLHTFRAARDWLFPCGGVRSVTFYPRRHEDDDGDPIDLPSEARISLLVTFSHPDGACKLVGAFKHFASRLDDRYSGLQAFMVPANKDVPLPPPLLDDESQQHLGEKLWQNFVGAESPELHGGELKEAHVPLDSDKVAAAAGGNNYDAEEDPLNAPAVLDAVKEFRRKLTKTQSYQKKKRMELVSRKVAEMRPRIKEVVEEERKRGPPPPPPPMVPPPDLPLPPPMMGGLPPPPPPVMGLPPPPDGVGVPGDSGKRGRSNLPAWMTTAGNDEEGVEPSSKRVKTMEDFPTHFPPLPETTQAPFKDFLAHQVQEALGEREEELITFLHSHVLAGGSSAEMLEELKMVLEDEAGPFLEAVWNRVNQLQA